MFHPILPCFEHLDNATRSAEAGAGGLILLVIRRSACRNDADNPLRERVHDVDISVIVHVPKFGPRW